MRPGMYCAAIEPTFIAGIRLRLLESLQRGVETEAKTTAIVEEAKKLLVYAERERPAMGLSWTAESERREPIGADASATAPRVDLHVFSASNPDNFEVSLSSCAVPRPRAPPPPHQPAPPAHVHQQAAGASSRGACRRRSR